MWQCKLLYAITVKIAPVGAKPNLYELYTNSNLKTTNINLR